MMLCRIPARGHVLLSEVRKCCLIVKGIPLSKQLAPLLPGLVLYSWDRLLAGTVKVQQFPPLYLPSKYIAASVSIFCCLTNTRR